MFTPNVSIRYLSNQFWCALHSTKTQFYDWVLKLNLHFVCLFVFAYLLSYWSSFRLTILEIKIKRYLHVSYMQLFDYLYIHNIHNILRYTENKNIKLEYLKSTSQGSYKLFLQPRERNVLGQMSLRKLHLLHKLHLSSFWFFAFLNEVLLLYFETEKTYWSRIMLVPLVSVAYYRLIFPRFVSM